MSTLAKEDAGAAPEVPRLEKADDAASLRSEWNEAAMEASNKDLVLSRREEALSIELPQ